MYDPRKDISYRHAEAMIAEVFEGYAGEVGFKIDDYPIQPFGLQQCDEQEPLNVTSRTFEAQHYFKHGSGRTLKEAVDEFVADARFPWPSLKNRFHIAWRRRPEIRMEQEFDTGQPVFKVTARYSLILDYEPFDKEKPAS